MENFERLIFGAWILLLYLTIQVHGRRKYPERVHDLIQERLQSRRSLTPGIWSEWSPWSPCSRSCGKGVSTQTRECQFKSTNDVKLTRSKKKLRDMKNVSNRCVGLYKRFQLCNQRACPETSMDFRSEQCAAFDKIPFKGRLFQWKPYVKGPNKCELNCQAVGYTFYAMMKKQVIDGTECEAGIGDRICVSGMCKHVGCDGIIGSNKTLDACGECGGTNSTCRIISGLFTRSLIPPGYHKITRIPSGACNMNITELRPSFNNLALRKPDGSFVFNGNISDVQSGGIYSDHSTKFIYQQHGHLENVYSTGPLFQAVDLMLISRQTNYGIKYEYTIPLNVSLMLPVPQEPYSKPAFINASFSTNNSPPVAQLGPKESYMYHFTDQSQSDGFSYRSHRNGKVQANGPQNLIRTPQSDKQRETKPIDNNQYSIPASEEYHSHHRHHHSKRYSWKVTDFTPCSKSCGGGIQQSIVQCVKENTQSYVDATFCEDLEKPPSTHRPCTIKPCPARWVSNDWSECSRTCGQGVQLEMFSCVQEISYDLNVTVSEKACLTPPPKPNSRACEIKPCAKWIMGSWEKCNVDCGVGEKKREVWCGEAGTTRKLPDWDCNPHERPNRITKCVMGVCLPKTWLFTDWSTHCSSECGDGVQTRKVMCAGDSNPNEIPDNSCDIDSKPESSRSCTSNKHCGGKWFTGPWSPCMTECGDGVSTRDVLCVTMSGNQHRLTSESHCHEASKPETHRNCTNSCQGEWFMADWSPCSRTCGVGLQTRELQCFDNQQRKSTACSLNDKPETLRKCFSSACPANDASSSSDDDEDIDDPGLSKSLATAQGNGFPRRKYKKIRKKNGKCKDRLKNCNLVVQARLCRFIHYKKKCCHSCSSHS